MLLQLALEVVDVDTVVADGFFGFDTTTAFPFCFLAFDEDCCSIRHTCFEIHSKLCISTSSYCDIYGIFFQDRLLPIDSKI